MFIVVMMLQANGQVVVDANGSGDFTTIQSAINYASPGATVFVNEGVYKENIVRKDSVILQGDDNAVIDAEGNGTAITLGNYCTVMGFSIINSGKETGIKDCGILAENVKECYILLNSIYNNGHYGIIINNSNVKVYHNFIGFNDVLGIYISGNTNFDIAFNIFTTNSYSGIDLRENPSGAIYNNNFIKGKSAIIYENYSIPLLNNRIFNNIFAYNENGLDVPDNFSAEVRYNCFYNNNYNWLNRVKDKEVTLHSTNLIKNPLFADYQNNNFYLKHNSPCIESGKNGSNIGYFTNGGKKDWSKHVAFTSMNSKYYAKFKGIAINHTAGDIQAHITALLTSSDGQSFSLEGQYDNHNLFGHFIMHGKATHIGDSIVIEFNNGLCYLGDDNSGYPEDTEMSHTGKIYISNGQVTGNYLCGLVPLSRRLQNGSYFFQIVDSNFKIDELQIQPDPEFTIPVHSQIAQNLVYELKKKDEAKVSLLKFYECRKR
jgi:hypothetical protein